MDNKSFIEELTRQCITCYYWRDIHTSGAKEGRDKCCHFILDEGKLTTRDGTTCYSYTPRRGWKNG